MKIIILAFVLSVTACSWGPWAKDNPTKEDEGFDPEVREAVIERMDLYCGLSKPKYLETATITDRCDAALYTGLHGMVCNYVTITQFESAEEPGKMCRRPGCVCFQNGKDTGSDSNWSKDMATGAQGNQAVRPDFELLSRIVKYGEDNNWVVCQGKDSTATLSKCVMSPKIISRWYDLRDRANPNLRLTSEDSHERYLNLVETYGDRQDEDAIGVKTDFRAHLDILGIVNEWLIHGAISSFSMTTLRKQAEREPKNLLYQSAFTRFHGGGRTDVAKALLEMFPADRLPTSNDWCEDYIFQRDYMRGSEVNNDWLPCDGNHTYTGTDFLLAAWLLIAADPE